MSTQLLDKLLDPESIVLIGASARAQSPGFKLTQNLVQGGYQGTLFLVNPRYQQVLDYPCYKTIKSIPEVPDLAIVLTPASILRRVLLQCARKGIKVAVVMTGTEQAGDLPSRALHEYAQKLGIRLMGPYCAGLIRPHINLNATFSANRIHKGNLAIVSQSASLGAALVDWAQTSNVGYSAMLSTGQDTDISLSDLLDLLAEDIHTKAVIVYVDHIHTTRQFLSALSATAHVKPVVLMHPVHQGVSYCDALTRTGEIYSSDNVFQAALNRAGVVRIRTFENLYAAAKILSSGIRVKGKRLAVVSNANAPAMMALERIGLKRFEAPKLKKGMLRKLYKKRKVEFSGSNPILLRNPSMLAEHYVNTLKKLQKQDSLDAILLVFVPDSRNDANEIAQAIVRCLPCEKPIITCWMGDASVKQARETLSQAGIPTFRTPEGATDGFDFLYRYFVSQQQLLQLPNPTSRYSRANVNEGQSLIDGALMDDVRVLDPERARELLRYFDVPVLASELATDVEQAIDIAKRMGYPVAMKLYSPSLVYKSSVLGTQLGISNDEQLSKTWALIRQRLTSLRHDLPFGGVLIEPMYAPENARSLAISVSRDSLFGPVISLRMGGQLSALHQKQSVHLPPLNRYLIDELLAGEQLQTYLGAFRHAQAVSDRPLANILRRVSELACELPDIFSLDLNPLQLSADGAMVMDVQVVVERAQQTHQYQHLAIHPYPWQWIRDVTLKDGSLAQLRPIRPDDANALQAMLAAMSAQSRYFRFMHAINRLSPQMIAQFTKLDYDRQMAFVATTGDIIVGACRYTINNDRLHGEFAISIADSSTGLGLATQLMKLMIAHAKSQHLHKLYGTVLRSNSPMQALMASLGFHAEASDTEPDVIIYSLLLQNPPHLE